MLFSLKFRSKIQICKVSKVHNQKLTTSGKLESILQNFFLCFFFFGVKLGHFTINTFFLYVTKVQAYDPKLTSEKQRNSSLAKKQSLVGSTLGL